MSNPILRREKFKTWALQLINCCLAYTLSLPVELDLNGVMLLAKDYLGVFSLLTIFSRKPVLLTARVSDQKIEKSFEELIA
jgi:hypothetical protein